MTYDEERKFLHDIANPLAVAQGNLKIALRKMEHTTDQQLELVELVERVQKAMDACEKMVKQISERRSQLQSEQNLSAPLRTTS